MTKGMIFDNFLFFFLKWTFLFIDSTCFFEVRVLPLTPPTFFTCFNSAMWFSDWKKRKKKKNGRFFFLLFSFFLFFSFFFSFSLFSWNSNYFSQFLNNYFMLLIHFLFHNIHNKEIFFFISSSFFSKSLTFVFEHHRI